MQAIQSAYVTLDPYHAAILGGWYVRQWSQPTCLARARRAAGDAHVRRRGDFASALSMAHALILEALALPALIRRERARARVALELRIPEMLVVGVLQDD